MKQKIITATLIVSLLFLFVGIYVVATIEKASRKIDDLLILHQAEVIREKLLVRIMEVRVDIASSFSHTHRDNDKTVEDVINLRNSIVVCRTCHHDKSILNEFSKLDNGFEALELSVNNAISMETDPERHKEEIVIALGVCEKLTENAETIVYRAAHGLADKTRVLRADISRTKNLLYLFVIVLPLLAGLGGVFFILAIHRPINALLEATRKLKKGIFDYRIEGLQDEFEEVGKAFNEMALSLKEQLLKMQRTEQMATIGELAAGLAHEIKNPLAGIKISVEVLAEEPCLAPEDKAIAIRAIDEIRRIEILIKSLLNFAKPPKPEVVETNINKVLDNSIAFSLNHPVVRSSNRPIQVAGTLSPDLPLTQADPSLLKQAFLNLLLNAIEAMPEGGVLTVSTKYHKDLNSIQITIADSGCGIESAVIDKIFQPFFTGKRKGTGLGLAITRRLIEQHGGDIYVESELGKGSKFNVFLPVKKEAA